jgi:pheromone shutdown-related protein TraB
MKYRNLTIIGTSHISRESIEAIAKFVEEKKPAIIAIELDKDRFYGIQQSKREAGFREIFQVGVKGYLFSLIGEYVERKLGEKVGVKPGQEMLTAIKLAKENNIKIALIDQDIRITLKRFSKFLSWKEKFRFVADIFKSIFFGKREMKKIGVETFDLTKVPEKKVIKKMISFVKKRYPNVYKVLIEERNVVMAKRLKWLVENEKGIILAVVGAGHEEEILNLIKKDLNIDK